MTSRDNDGMDDSTLDAEFADFLQGQGELARLLKELPQAQPTPELDAAIMADATTALAKSARPSQPAVMATPVLLTAANDGVGPAGQAGQQPGNISRMPSFLSRWKLPLGLAASILLALPLYLLQQANKTDTPDQVTVVASNSPHKNKTDEATQLAQAEQRLKIPAPAPVAESTSAEKPLAIQAPASPPTSVPAAAPVAKTKVEQHHRKDEAKRVPVKQEKMLAKAEPDALPANATATAPTNEPPIVVAAAPIELKPVVITGSSIRRQNSESASPTQILAKRANEDDDDAEAAKLFHPSNATIASKEATTASRARRDEKLAPSSLTVAAKPVMPAAPPAEIQARVTAQAASSDRRAEVSATIPATNARAAFLPETLPDAKEWLQQIEKLIADKHNTEALAEWKKFQQAYPSYVISKALQNKIEALQK